MALARGERRVQPVSKVVQSAEDKAREDTLRWSAEADPTAAAMTDLTDWRPWQAPDGFYPVGYNGPGER